MIIVDKYYNMSIKNQRLIQIAAESALSVNGNMKHCALLVAGRRIIKKTSNNIHSHAETNIVRYLNKIKRSGKTKKFDLYVCRVNENGQLRNSKPCFHCIEEIKRTDMISNIVYSDFDFSENTPYCISERIENLINQHISFGNRKKLYD